MHVCVRETERERQGFDLRQLRELAAVYARPCLLCLGLETEVSGQEAKEKADKRGCRNKLEPKAELEPARSRHLQASHLDDTVGVLQESWLPLPWN